MTLRPEKALFDCVVETTDCEWRKKMRMEKRVMLFFVWEVFFRKIEGKKYILIIREYMSHIVAFLDYKIRSFFNENVKNE